MKRMKQVCLLMVFLACLFLPATALAADAEAMEIGVQLNGSNLQFTDAVPVMEDGRVYVPFRAVFEALDADVNYDKATSTIEAQKGETTVKFVIGNPDVVVDGDMVFTTDAPSFVRDGRMPKLPCCAMPSTRPHIRCQILHSCAITHIS